MPRVALTKWIPFWGLFRCVFFGLMTTVMPEVRVGWMRHLLSAVRYVFFFLVVGIRALVYRLLYDRL